MYLTQRSAGSSTWMSLSSTRKPCFIAAPPPALHPALSITSAGVRCAPSVGSRGFASDRPVTSPPRQGSTGCTWGKERTVATGGGFRLRGRQARRVARAVMERAGRRPHLFVWGAVAAFVALDAVPSASLHAPLAAVAVLAAATWSHLHARRTWRARSRYLSDLVLELRRRSQRYELAATTDELTGLANAPEFRRRLERALDPDPGNPGAPGAVLVNRYQLLQADQRHPRPSRRRQRTETRRPHPARRDAHRRRCRPSRR